MIDAPRYNSPLKYSLRSLMIVGILVPPVLALMIWPFLPAPAAKRGAPEDMRVFLRVIKEPYSSAIFDATDKCFVVGEQASRYQAILAQKNASGPSEYYKFPAGTQYEFWCEGKSPANEGDAVVVVIVDGNPLVIVSAGVSVVTK